jgi:predicted amidohydrolase YtcJ
MMAKTTLPMMTINAVYTLFRDDEVGSLEPGKYADLIILSENPLAFVADEIPGLEIWMTMVGGVRRTVMKGTKASAHKRASIMWTSRQIVLECWQPR